LRGGRTMEEAVEDVRRSHRRYARRQATWNRHQLPPGAIFLDAALPQTELVEAILNAWSDPGDVPEETSDGREQPRRSGDLKVSEQAGEEDRRGERPS
ncbi:MAG: hypothetical protein ACWGSQ_09745, partial [Longimicrobiales bacterium]